MGLIQFHKKLLLRIFFLIFFSQVKNSHSMKNSFDIFSLVVLIIFIRLTASKNETDLKLYLVLSASRTPTICSLALVFLSWENFLSSLSSTLFGLLHKQEEIMRDILEKRKYMLSMLCALCRLISTRIYSYFTKIFQILKCDNYIYLLSTY